MTIPRGIYRIYQWGSFENPQFLTSTDGIITVAPHSAQHEKEQEWSVETLENGHVAIQHPAHIIPSSSLSFEGKPEAGDRIVRGRVSDFPTREWIVERAPQLPLPVPYFIRVPENKELIVAVSPLKIHPTQLALTRASFDLTHAWAFELLHHAE